jgi:hypothetical protein
MQDNQGSSSIDRSKITYGFIKNTLKLYETKITLPKSFKMGSPFNELGPLLQTMERIVQAQGDNKTDSNPITDAEFFDICSKFAGSVEIVKELNDRCSTYHRYYCYKQTIDLTDAAYFNARQLVLINWMLVLGFDLVYKLAIRNPAISAESTLDSTLNDRKKYREFSEQIKTLLSTPDLVHLIALQKQHEDLTRTLKNTYERYHQLDHTRKHASQDLKLSFYSTHVIPDLAKRKEAEEGFQAIEVLMQAQQARYQQLEQLFTPYRYDCYLPYTHIAKEIETLDALQQGVKTAECLHKEAKQTKQLDALTQSYQNVIAKLAGLIQNIQKIGPVPVIAEEEDKDQELNDFNSLNRFGYSS